VEALLDQFAKDLEQETAPMSTGEVRLQYGQVLTFRTECPHCGRLIYPPRHGTYNRHTQRVLCPDPQCRRQFVIGLILWPLRPGSHYTYQRPRDTKATLRHMAQLRDPFRARVPEIAKKGGDAVNVLGEELEP
jgi:transposase-like protein